MRNTDDIEKLWKQKYYEKTQELVVVEGQLIIARMELQQTLDNHPELRTVTRARIEDTLKRTS